MKRILSLLMALCLLAGCAGSASSAAPAVTQAPAPTAVPQTLTAYCETGAAALEAYAEARNVDLTLTDSADEADLVILNEAPADGYRDLLGDDLLAAAASRAGLTGESRALPLGRTLYAYWADSAVLTALLGENSVTDLQNANWTEWSALVGTLTEWLARPAETELTINGKGYTLPETLPEGLTLDGVFAVEGDRAPGWTGVLLAAGEPRTADTLTGAVNGLYSAVTLEWDNAAAESPLFIRARLSDLLAARGIDGCQTLVPVPFKCEFVEEDLFNEEYNLTGLMNYPVLTTAGWLAVPDTADADGAKAAAGAILWLYTSAQGEKVLTEELGLITPWDTASDNTALGSLQVRQVSTGILPAQTLSAGAAQALNEAEQALQGVSKRTKAQRTAFVDAVLQALGAE